MSKTRDIIECIDELYKKHWANNNSNLKQTKCQQCYRCDICVSHWMTKKNLRVHFRTQKHKLNERRTKYLRRFDEFQ